mmetsp:Transcript_21133/g.46076  ORF Transcript_21133/g.46076 Transcript_21133/m.46076 type:complete len:138 (+) Transcript_21133:811-1224(+)
MTIISETHPLMDARRTSAPSARARPQHRLSMNRRSYTSNAWCRGEAVLADGDADRADDPPAAPGCAQGKATGLGSGSVGRVKSIGSNLHGGASGEFSVNARFENKNIRRDPVRSADPKRGSVAAATGVASGFLPADT